MKRLLLFSLMACMLLGCCTKRLTSLPSSLEASPTFQTFWDTYSEETASLKCLKNYTPSDELVSLYGLQGDDYVVNGFIYTDDTFSPTDVKCAVINEYQAYVYSYKVPLKDLEQLLMVKGIRRIEISKPNKLKIK